MAEAAGSEAGPGEAGSDLCSFVPLERQQPGLEEWEESEQSGTEDEVQDTRLGLEDREEL